MALYPGRGGNDASIRIYNNDGSEAGACGNGMRCVASLDQRRDGQGDAEFRDAGRDRFLLVAQGTGLFTVDMGAPRFRWNEIPLARNMLDTRAIELQFGPPDAPILHSPSVVSMGNPHAIFWVDDPQAYDLARDRSAAGTPSAVSGARQYHARGDALARACGDPHLGARRRPDQGLRLGGLRRRGRRGAARPHRPQGDGHACPAAISRSSGARATITC